MVSNWAVMSDTRAHSAGQVLVSRSRAFVLTPRPRSIIMRDNELERNDRQGVEAVETYAYAYHTGQTWSKAGQGRATQLEIAKRHEIREPRGEFSDEPEGRMAKKKVRSGLRSTCNVHFEPVRIRARGQSPTKPKVRI